MCTRNTRAIGPLLQKSSRWADPNFWGCTKKFNKQEGHINGIRCHIQCNHGTVKPWKHIVTGLGLASLTGLKMLLQIVNREEHSISYTETKGLVTEFAYSISSDDHDALDGIRLLPDWATGSVCNNNDAKMDILDGKATLHSTVGHTYQNVMPQDKGSSDSNLICFSEDRKRRTFVGS